MTLFRVVIFALLRNGQSQHFTVHTYHTVALTQATATDKVLRAFKARCPAHEIESVKVEDCDHLALESSVSMNEQDWRSRKDQGYWRMKA